MTSLDEQNELNSSDSSADETIIPVQQEAPIDNAASSPATEGEDKDMLSIVRDVVDKAAEPKSDAASPPAGEEVGEIEASKKDEDDYSDVPFNKHPRFKAVTTENRNLKAKVSTLEPDAQRYRYVQDFLDQNGMSAEEASELLQVGALIKTNPVEAWARMKPVVEKLLQVTGEIVPEDLKSRIQNGELSHEAALELSRARAKAETLSASQSFREQLEARRSQEATANSLRDTAQSWVDDRTAKDPNFNAKMPLLQTVIEALHYREGKPKTPQGVTDQLQRAYKTVNEMAPIAAIAPAVPKQRPITPVRGGQIAGNQRPAEQSTLEIIRARTGR